MRVSDFGLTSTSCSIHFHEKITNFYINGKNTREMNYTTLLNIDLADMFK